MHIRRTLFFIAACALIVVIGCSLYQSWGIYRSTLQEAELHSRLLQYRPPEQEPASAKFVPDPALEAFSELVPDAARKVNQSIADLQAAFPDAVGWLTIPHTGMDHPFVQGRDNMQYLHLDFEQNQSAAGTIFMDFRNSRDFSDFNTIFFGRDMRSGSMFGTLRQFNDQAFFEQNRSGTLFLVDKTYKIDFIAFAVIPPDDAVIYDPMITTDTERSVFLYHVRSVARHYRDANVTTEDRFITLSTRNEGFNDVSMVLIGRLME